MPATPEFIVIFQQVVTTTGGDFDIAYSWDGQRFADYDDAVSHGFETRGSDDFNLGQLAGRRLVSFSWMNEELDHDLAEIAHQLTLTA
jgi:hypothetical protein